MSNDIIKLDDVQHILLRPNMYIGSISEEEETGYFLDGEIINFKPVKYIKGFLKLINEILDNSIDESIKTNFQFANRIDVSITDTSITITDNGRGIPVKKITNGEDLMPVVAFTHTKAGSNFNDDGRKTIGMNGVGSTCVNVFSSIFNVDTCDGEQILKLRCKNNLSEHTFTINPAVTKGTKVYFEPDLVRFGLTKIEDVYKDLIKQRLFFLSLSFPQIYFSFNKIKVKCPNNYSLSKMFSEHSVYLDSKDYMIVVAPNNTDDFKQFSYVNGLYTKEGGNHINIITADIVAKLRERIVKSYKNIMPGDVKNKIQLIVFFNNFPDMKFDSQTKEKLTNSTDEIRRYMNMDEKNFINFIGRIYGKKEIIDPIVEIYKIKEEFKRREDAKKILSTPMKIKAEKYLPPIGGTNKYLVLGEGDSAINGLIRALGRTGFGYYALKGKTLNTYDVDAKRALENEELKTITKILGVKLDNESPMSFESVLIASDQDLDGILIRGLLLTFFVKYCKNLVIEGKIKFLKTPMILVYKNKKMFKYFFNFQEYNEFMKVNTETVTMTYCKGLGTFKDELSELFKTEGIEGFMETFEYDKDVDDPIIKSWMSKDCSDDRKAMIFPRSFNLEKL